MTGILFRANRISGLEEAGKFMLNIASAMLSRRLYIPFALWLGIVLYLTFVEERSGVMVWMIPPALALMLIYTFSPQLDWWWMKKYPPQADPVLKHLLEKINPWYRTLPSTGKTTFETKVLMYVEGRDFSTIQGQEQPKEDEKCLIACAAVHMTYFMEDFLIEPYEKIIFYQHPFPSPNHPFLHICESDTEDSVLIFALEQVWQGWLKPQKFINPVYYELARVLRLQLSWTEPIWPIDFWERVTAISTLNKEGISKYLGFAEPDLFGVASALFFTHSERMRMISPNIYEQLNKLYCFPSTQPQ